MHRDDLPRLTIPLQNAAGDAEPVNDLVRLGDNAVTVGFGRDRDRPFEPDLRLVVFECEGFEFGEFRPKMMVAVCLIGSFNLSRFDDNRIAREERVDTGKIPPLDL